MPSGPPRGAQAVVAFLIPPACREEVLGDLQERYRSTSQYCWEALFTIPLVIASRIRRTTDAAVLVMQALALYSSFLVAAWFKERALLQEPWGLLRLATPAGMVLITLIVRDAYSRPGEQSFLQPVHAPFYGVVLAAVMQMVFWQVGHGDWSIPGSILSYGSAMSIFLSSTVRLWFPPVTVRLRGANAPADWLKQAEPDRMKPETLGVIKTMAAIAATAVAVAVMGSDLPAWIIASTAVLLAYLLKQQR